MGGRVAAKKPLLLEQIEDKLTIWMQRLDLLHWEIRIELNPDPGGEGSDPPPLAAITAQDEIYDHAILRLLPQVLEWPGDCWGLTWDHDPDKVIAHELVHVVMRDQDRAALYHTEGVAQIRQLEAALETQYHEARERAVEHLAIALVNGWGPA